MKYSIEQLNHAYHTLGDPLISDAEYDLLQSETVGAPIAIDAVGVERSTPMLSIRNTESLMAFTSRCPGPFIAEPKVDGLAISLVYVDGRLVQASTRGDGFTGEDVTDNAIATESIPNRLLFDVSIEARGEIYMPLDVFAGTNMKNARSAAAGSIQLKSPERCRERRLGLYAYQVVGSDCASHGDTLDYLSSLGLPVNSERRVCNSYDECKSYFKYLESIRDSLNYEIDGVVFKVDSISEQHSLGSNKSAPLWAVAEKFAAAIAESVITSIEYGVSKGGRETAVALIQPIDMGGKTIARVNLYNPRHVAEIGAGSGARVALSGDTVASVSHVIEKVAYDGPALPEKVLIGPVLYADLDAIFAMVDSY